MSEVADNFQQQAIRKFSQGPEIDTALHVEQAISGSLNELPAELSGLLEDTDPFTKKKIMESLEDYVRNAIEAGIDIGEQTEAYRRQYEEYGWQYDETPLVASQEGLQKLRLKKMTDLALGMRRLALTKAADDTTIGGTI